MDIISPFDERIYVTMQHLCSSFGFFVALKMIIFSLFLFTTFSADEDARQVKRTCNTRAHHQKHPFLLALIKNQFKRISFNGVRTPNSHKL